MMWPKLTDTQALQGLHYLQTSRRLVHRDIKSSNLLLFLDGRVQIGDLGLCEEIKGGELMPLPIAGSRCWMAPEVIYNKPYGFKADSWSLGCVLLEMANGRAPYHELAALKCLFLFLLLPALCLLTPITGMVMLATKGSPGFWTPKKWGSAFKDFVGQCFHKNQRTRAGIADLLKACAFLSSSFRIALVVLQLLTGVTAPLLGQRVRGSRPGGVPSCGFHCQYPHEHWTGMRCWLSHLMFACFVM